MTATKTRSSDTDVQATAPKRRSRWVIRGIIAIVGIGIGWLAEQMFDTLKEAYFPNSYDLRAEEARNVIRTQTEDIQAIVNQMGDQLADIHGGDAQTDAIRVLVSQAERLVDRAQAIEPAIDLVGEVAGDLAAIRLTAKGAQLKSSGVSIQPDTIIPSAGAVTLCDGSFTFGIDQIQESGFVPARLTRGSKRAATSTLRAGESLEVSSPTIIARASHAGLIEDGNDRRIGVNVSCEPNKE